MTVTMIGAALRLEGGGGFLDRCAELAEHVGNHLIRTYQQSFAIDLNCNMAIANVPGKAGEMARIMSADREERLGQSANLDHRVVFEQ
jgi:hypothetical protein